MCGISAIFRYTSISESDKKKLSLMNQEMKYRGPDDSGLWYDNHCGLAQVRLSIIGLDNGKQPIVSKDRSLVLICNGEIYNYIELKEELIKKGHVFYTDTDTEVILHLYEDYGTESLQYLRGMFAFCLWDLENQQLFVARDRVGEKPIYYSEIPCGIVFSSELKAILKHYIPEPSIDTSMLLEAIRYSFPINRKDTYINQIKRLEPGHYLLINKFGMNKEVYWRKENHCNYNGTLKDAIIKTRELLFDSVRICLRSDVPVAVLLSGGIDSSAIAALAKEIGVEVYAITAGYKGNFDVDERAIAKRFADEKGLIWQDIELNIDDYIAYFEEYSAVVDEPVCDIAAFAQWGLYKKVKELGFKVLLSGNGGDELFYGYPYWNKIGESISALDKHIKIRTFKGYKKKIELLKFAFNNLRYIVNGSYTKPYDEKVFSPNFFSSFLAFIRSSGYETDWNNINHKSFWQSGNMPGIEKVYTTLFNTWLSANCLYLGDRLGMGNSLEVRSPFVDYKLIDFVSSLPIEMKYRSNTPKFLLKKVLHGIVPDYILNASKKAFTPPIIFINELVDMYNYGFFKKGDKFFNSVFADNLLSNFADKLKYQ